LSYYRCGSKIAVTLDRSTVADLDRWVREGKYPNRSRALQSAVDMLNERDKRTRRARELAKLDPKYEKELAEEGLGGKVASILRGDVYWADLNPVRGREQAGLRPVLILSNELFNRRSETAIVMAITSQPQRAGFPLTIALAEGALPKQSWLKNIAGPYRLNRTARQEDCSTRI